MIKYIKIKKTKIKKDDILAQAGYKTYRFMSNNKPSVEELRFKVLFLDK